ncbi:hypothetical protein ABK040_000678 [Willaertia magna]
MSNRAPWLTKDFSKTFYDSQTLIYDDIVLLFGSNWLNDNIINYYFLYLENEKYKNPDYCFVAPSVSFWVSMIEDEEDIRASLDPLNVKEKKLIFIPINDNTDINAVSGGSHWSLVVFDRDTKVFYYFDSGSNMNKKAALNTVKKMSPFFGEGLSNPTFEVMKSPQQNNGFDCGVYVLAMADFIAGKGMNNISTEITPSVVSNLRKEVFSLIEKGVEK